MTIENIKALRMAEQWHKNQFRATGEPYITHPISVATLLMQKGFGGTYITIAYLHDVIEDCGVDVSEIEKEFGANVADSVDALTKKFKGIDKTGFSMSSYIVGIQNDIFAKDVKLADRLHNLLTSVEMNEAFKLKYIRETEDYYLNLAKDSLFEEDIKSALLRLKQSYAFSVVKNSVFENDINNALKHR